MSESHNCHIRREVRSGEDLERSLLSIFKGRNVCFRCTHRACRDSFCCESMALTKVPRRYFPCRYRYLITLFASSLAVVCLNNFFYCFNGDTEIDGPALVRFDPNTSEVARNGSLGVFRIAIPQYFPKANRRQFERVIVIGTLRNPDEQEAISRGSLMTGFHLHFESTKTPAEERDNAGKFSKVRILHFYRGILLTVPGKRSRHRGFPHAPQRYSKV